MSLGLDDALGSPLLLPIANCTCAGAENSIRRSYNFTVSVMFTVTNR